jgi:murein L,D-transpeptidase YcbB/YkuD
LLKFVSILVFVVLAAPALAEAPTRLASASIATERPAETVGDLVRARLADPALTRDARLRDGVTAFYAGTSFAPRWTTEEGWTPIARRVIARLGQARSDGFEPVDYDRLSFRSLSERATTAERAGADVDLSMSLALYVRHAVSGRIDPRRLAPHVVATPPQADVIAELVRISSSETPVAAMEALHPSDARFLSLRRELGRLLVVYGESIEARSRPAFPFGPNIRQGMRDPRVPDLRRHFATIAPENVAVDLMDRILVSAVRAFQSAHGLDANGVVGQSTIRAINEQGTPVDEGTRARLAAIVVNMERWRWVPRDLGEVYVWVNVPTYMAHVVDRQRVTLSSRVVVGKPETPTPMFSDTMEYFVVNPSWGVPPGIAERQMFPLLRDNPGELARRGIQVIRHANGGVSFRQPPGERNALGRIKFMFPNSHAIYLHDTPNRGDFQRTRRAYSNGCVRVDLPLRFAEAAFARGDNLTSARIESMYGPNERTVRLRNQVQVHLTYFTTEIDAVGTVTALEDIYGLDRRMRLMLGV